MHDDSEDMDMECVLLVEQKKKAKHYSLYPVMTERT